MEEWVDKAVENTMKRYSTELFPQLKMDPVAGSTVLMMIGVARSVLSDPRAGDKDAVMGTMRAFRNLGLLVDLFVEEFNKLCKDGHIDPETLELHGNGVEMEGSDGPTTTH